MSTLNRVAPLKISKIKSDCGDAGDDGLLWAQRLYLLPPASRRSFLDTVARLSREAAEADRRATALAEEIERLRPPPTREQMMARRDAAIVQALAGYQGAMTARADGLAKDLRRATGLDGSASSERMQMACEVLALNGGRPLASRQIYKIWCRR